MYSYSDRDGFMIGAEMIVGRIDDTSIIVQHALTGDASPTTSGA